MLGFSQKKQINLEWHDYEKYQQKKGFNAFKKNDHIRHLEVKSPT